MYARIQYAINGSPIGCRDADHEEAPQITETTSLHHQPSVCNLYEKSHASSELFNTLSSPLCDPSHHPASIRCSRIMTYRDIFSYLCDAIYVHIVKDTRIVLKVIHFLSYSSHKSEFPPHALNATTHLSPALANPRAFHARSITIGMRHTRGIHISRSRL